MNDEDRDDDGFNLHELYHGERRLLIYGEREMTRALDRSIIALSGGAIGLSLVLLDQLAPIREVWLLVASWLALAAAIGSTLLSYRWAQGWLEAQREAIGAFYMEKIAGTDADPETVRKTREHAEGLLAKRDKLVGRTRRFNAVALIAFGVGTAALLSFGLVNVTTSQEALMGDRERATGPGPGPQKKGYVDQDIPAELLPDDAQPADAGDPSGDSGTAEAGDETEGEDRS